MVTLSTTTLVSAVAVTVTASNSGGSATSSFKVTVKAIAPAALQAADWSIGAVEPLGRQVDPALQDPQGRPDAAGRALDL